MDGPFYVSILKSQLLSAVQNMYNKNWRLQQDNDPKHTPKVAQEFIARNRIKIVDWSTNSPDLNLVENVWKIVKDKVEIRMPKNIEELKQFLAEEWNAIPENVVNNLIQSMKIRCELILEKDGERISF